MKIKMVRVHSAVTLENGVHNFFSSDQFDISIDDSGSWVLVKGRRKGETVAIPAANIPFVQVEIEVPIPAPVAPPAGPMKARA